MLPPLTSLLFGGAVATDNGDSLAVPVAGEVGGKFVDAESFADLMLTHGQETSLELESEANAGRLRLGLGVNVSPTVRAVEPPTVESLAANARPQGIGLASAAPVTAMAASTLEEQLIQRLHTSGGQWVAATADGKLSNNPGNLLPPGGKLEANSAPFAPVAATLEPAARWFASQADLSTLRLRSSPVVSDRPMAVPPNLNPSAVASLALGDQPMERSVAQAVVLAKLEIGASATAGRNASIEAGGSGATLPIYSGQPTYNAPAAPIASQVGSQLGSESIGLSAAISALSASPPNNAGTIAAAQMQGAKPVSNQLPHVPVLVKDAASLNAAAADARLLPNSGTTMPANLGTEQQVVSGIANPASSLRHAGSTVVQNLESVTSLPGERTPQQALVQSAMYPAAALTTSSAGASSPGWTTAYDASTTRLQVNNGTGVATTQPLQTLATQRARLVQALTLRSDSAGLPVGDSSATALTVGGATSLAPQSANPAALVPLSNTPAAATNPSAATPTLELGGLTGEQLANRLSQFIAGQHGAGGTLRIGLSPVSLGALEISFQRSAAGLEVRLSAQQQQTRALLESHLASIRTGLHDLGNRDAQVLLSPRWTNPQATTGTPAGGDQGAEANDAWQQSSDNPQNTGAQQDNLQQQLDDRQHRSPTVEASDHAQAEADQRTMAQVNSVQEDLMANPVGAAGELWARGATTPSPAHINAYI